MPQIVIEQPGVPPMTVPVSGREITFGRSEDNDVVLTAEEVSRVHARIVQKGGRLFITDLKSLNGTYVNRQRITEQALRHLDEIWFGSKCHLIYRDDTTFGALRTESEKDSEGNDTALERSIQNIRMEMTRAGRDMTSWAGRLPERIPLYRKSGFRVSRRRKNWYA